MKIGLFDSVMMARSLPEHGLLPGDIGDVVEIYEHNELEVEFVSASGRTTFVTLRRSDVRPVEKGKPQSLDR